MAKGTPNRERIRELEDELLRERQTGFSCPVCGSEGFAERSVWRGDSEKENSGEHYHYWACVLNGHDVTDIVAPFDDNRKRKPRESRDEAAAVEAVVLER